VDGRAALEEEGLKATVERLLPRKLDKPMKVLMEEFFTLYKRPPLGDDLTSIWISRPA
jgi:hypothetical protein